MRETLKSSKKIGIAKVIIHTREYLAALIPDNDALILNLLRYHQEIKKPTEFDLPILNIKSYKISAKEMEIAKQLVASMTSKWKPDDYQDEFKVSLQKFIDDKIHKRSPVKKKSTKISATPDNVINFVDLLKKSLKNKTSVNKLRIQTKKNKR